MATLANLSVLGGGSTTGAGGHLLPLALNATGVNFDASGPITGTLAATLVSLISTLGVFAPPSGQVLIAGSASDTLSAATVLANNALPADVTLSATGTVTQAAGLTLALLQIVANGTVSNTGALTAVLGAATLAASNPRPAPNIGGISRRSKGPQRLYVEYNGKMILARDAEHADEIEAREAYRLTKLQKPATPKKAAEPVMPLATQKPEFVDLQAPAQRDQDEEDVANIL